MDDKRTCDSILQWMKIQVENKNPISPHLWLEAAQMLNVLSSDESDRLIDLESILARKRENQISLGKTVAASNIVVEASMEYNETRKQGAKIKQIEEAIRLAKLSARIKNDEMLRS